MNVYIITYIALPRLLRYVAKVLYQTVDLLWVMLRQTRKPSHMIVQVYTRVHMYM